VVDSSGARGTTPERCGGRSQVSCGFFFFVAAVCLAFASRDLALVGCREDPSARDFSGRGSGVGKH
jgi:hypothetical protein